MLLASFKKYILDFKFAAKTSRNTLNQKPTYFLFLKDFEKDLLGIGECSTISGLSIDPENLYESKLSELCKEINNQNSYDFYFDLKIFPSIKFGLETAIKGIKNSCSYKIFLSDFIEGHYRIPINGLIWMGDIDFMKKQIHEKIEAGYDCLKLKIGAHHFDEEIDLIRQIRKAYSSEKLCIRVDANGAFQVKDALEKLKILGDNDIHSIEQPIKTGLYDEMAYLCEQSPIPIALDEELIGIFDTKNKIKMLNHIKPQYIILKPSLLGVFEASSEWINLAQKNQIGWWITSALESNIGLNAIAQWASTYEPPIPQGLGTGQLYHNNFPSPLCIEKGYLGYNPELNWDYSQLLNS